MLKSQICKSLPFYMESKAYIFAHWNVDQVQSGIIARPFKKPIIRYLAFVIELASFDKYAWTGFRIVAKFV